VSGESRDESTPCWICQPQNSTSNFTYGKYFYVIFSFCKTKVTITVSLLKCSLCYR